MHLSDVVNNNAECLLKNMNMITCMGSGILQVQKSDIMCLSKALAIQGAQIISMTLGWITEQNISDLHEPHRPPYVYCLNKDS